MTTQNNPVQYAKAIQAQLKSIVGPTWPVYANFNRNWESEPNFITWQLRSVHQPVYTGSNQSVKGIDTPVFQTSIFAKQMDDAFNIANTILQSLHGYSGLFGGSTNGFQLSKADVVWLYNTYDNTVGLHQIILDTTLYVPA